MLLTTIDRISMMNVMGNFSELIERNLESHLKKRDRKLAKKVLLPIVKMELTKFEQNIQKRIFSADFDIEVFDHYGLNSEDIDPKIKGGFFGPANFEGFLCWFILQHKCGYKPFYTILKMKTKIIHEKY